MFNEINLKALVVKIDLLSSFSFDAFTLLIQKDLVLNKLSLS